MLIWIVKVTKSYHIWKLILVEFFSKNCNDKSIQKSRAKICIKKKLSLNVCERFSFITVSPNRFCFPCFVLQNAHYTELLHYPMSRPNLPSSQNEMRSSFSRSLARSFSLKSDVLWRGWRPAGGIKRFIFTRVTASHASWHNASGNSRAFRTPSRCILTGAGPAQTSVVPIGVTHRRLSASEVGVSRTIYH